MATARTCAMQWTKRVAATEWMFATNWVFATK
jgi:hypothetical protein